MFKIFYTLYLSIGVILTLGGILGAVLIVKDIFEGIILIILK